jgi:hypothetical protein
MFVDPWSVSTETLDYAAGQLFAFSLIPYLAFLYFLSKKEVEIPPLASFGFQFLRVFVFATIPAGVYAKVHYHDILANVDWLHGSAESLLTVTNLLIAIGFRDGLRTPQARKAPEESKERVPTVLNSPVTAAGMALALGIAPVLLSMLHPEPWNALSYPTWIIHVSSLIEWLVAMGLVWQYADATGNSRWKGLTWGMLPLHTSGICACTYHLFYNATSLDLLVTLQAALTCLGNVTLAVAAYRLFRAGSLEDSFRSTAAATADASPRAVSQQSASVAPPDARAGLVGFEDLGNALKRDSSAAFVGKLLALSAVGAAAVKWGSLFMDGVFHPDPRAAMAIICVPTALNMLKWTVRSREPESNFGDLF